MFDIGLTNSKIVPNCFIIDGGVLDNPFVGKASTAALAYREWLWMNLQSVKTGERMVNVHKLASHYGLDLNPNRKIAKCSKVVEAVDEVMYETYMCGDLLLSHPDALKADSHLEMLAKCLMWVHEQLPPWDDVEDIKSYVSVALTGEDLSRVAAA